MENNKKNVLEWLLSYELILAARYRYYVTLVYISTKNQNSFKLKFEDMIESEMRECDQCFTLDGNIAVLMSNTSLKDAQKAIERYKKVCNGTLDLRYSIVLYPHSPTVELIMDSACERLGLP